MDQKAIDVSALEKKVRTYRQLINFIRQNWLAIALNIALAVICAWSIRYGFSRHFDWAISSIIMAMSVIVMMSVIAGAEVTNATVARNLNQISHLIGTFPSAFIGYSIIRYFMTTNNIIIAVILGAITGWAIYMVVRFFVHVFGVFGMYSIVDSLWERYKKYCLSIVLATMTFTVLLASSFQNVDARSWKFDRGTGKMVEDAVFIRPGSTLEREYFVVERKPQREMFTYIWIPAIEDAIWSGDREPNSLRKEVVLTCMFKNYKAYQKIHGRLPEMFVISPSRKEAPEDVGLTLLRYTGLTSEDVEINKVDGLE